jgi:hypothetical protein
MLFDLDELQDLRLPMLGVERCGPLSIEARHHLAGDATPLRTQVERRLADHGIETGGPTRLLCMPAVFGVVFNPLSVFFCHRPDGSLAAILYEVNNTFGGRHCYVLPVKQTAAGTVRQQCDKTFHVSPFLAMDLRYAFTITAPGANVRIGITASDSQGVILDTSFVGVAEPLTNRTLAAVLLDHPFLMLEVLLAIHWQALKMVVKGRCRSNDGRSPPGPQ